MGNKKFRIWLPLLFSIVLIGGMFFGFKLSESNPPGRSFFKSNHRNSFQEIMELVRLRYVDSVKMDSLQDNAIDEMMSQLDPHSIYIPASHLQEVNEDLIGNFEGIGVEFNIFYDTVHVVHVISNGPSDKAGLMIGDKIIKVNNENITGSAFTSEEIKKRIKGERGSVVNLTIIRNGMPKEISVTRGTIPIPALDASYMIDKNTGYIKLNKFSESAYEEFMKALEDLKKNDLKKLVLDLRVMAED